MVIQRQNLIISLLLYHIIHVATLAKIQTSGEASHHLTLMNNCQTFYAHVFVFVKGFLWLPLWPNYKVQGDCIIS